MCGYDKKTVAVLTRMQQQSQTSATHHQEQLSNGHTPEPKKNPATPASQTEVWEMLCGLIPSQSPQPPSPPPTPLLCVVSCPDPLAREGQQVPAILP